MTETWYRGIAVGSLVRIKHPFHLPGRLPSYRICLQVQGFPLICWIKPRHSSLPMWGLCRLQRLCQSKGRAVQAHTRIHTTAYEKVSRLSFLYCRHCIIHLWGLYFGGFFVLLGFFPSCTLNLPGFYFLGNSPDFGFPTDSCDLLSLRALKHVIRQAWSSVCSDLQRWDLETISFAFGSFSFKLKISSSPLCL